MLSEKVVLYYLKHSFVNEAVETKLSSLELEGNIDIWSCIAWSFISSGTKTSHKDNVELIDIARDLKFLS